MSAYTKYKLLNILGQSIKTHEGNTEEDITFRVQILLALFELGFTVRVIGKDANGTEAIDSINNFYSVRSGCSFVSINLVHPVGLDLHVDAGTKECGIGGKGYSSCGKTYGDFKTIKQLKARAKKAVARAQGIIDRKAALEVDAKDARAVKVALAKDVFGDDVTIKITRGYDWVDAEYKDFRFTINDDATSSFKIGGKWVNINLNEAKALIDIYA